MREMCTLRRGRVVVGKQVGLDDLDAPVEALLRTAHAESDFAHSKTKSTSTKSTSYLLHI